jgi:2-amino-4-hydroxy-6-hydroxymethyldihydropteridine diphosphokinase
VIAFLALGSNLGDRRANLEAGLEALRELGTVTPSPLVMETPDEGGIGPDYLNTVALLETGLDDPRALLEALLHIEQRLGRVRPAVKGSPRTLDVDIVSIEGRVGAWEWLCPGDLIVSGGVLRLELPHPRAEGRDFVREPLRALERALGKSLE